MLSKSALMEAAVSEFPELEVVGAFADLRLIQNQAPAMIITMTITM